MRARESDLIELICAPCALPGEMSGLGSAAPMSDLRRLEKSTCAIAPNGVNKNRLVRIWWNWQTRYFEVVVPQGVQVQILLSAPKTLPK